MLSSHRRLLNVTAPPRRKSRDTRRRQNALNGERTRPKKNRCPVQEIERHRHDLALLGLFQERAREPTG